VATTARYPSQAKTVRFRNAASRWPPRRSRRSRRRWRLTGIVDSSEERAGSEIASGGCFIEYPMGSGHS